LLFCCKLVLKVVQPVIEPLAVGGIGCGHGAFGAGRSSAARQDPAHRENPNRL
jgi:hypothetical protein